MNLEEQEREKKQAYLRNNILDQGYDTELFLNYLTETRPENGQDIDAWNYLELKFVVKQFIDQFPPGENKYQEQQEENENENQYQQQQNFEDNKQENQYEETRKPETQEQKQEQIKTNYSVQKEEITPKPQEKVNQYENKSQYNSNNMTNINKSNYNNSQQTPQPVQNKSPFENLIVPPQKRNFQNTPSPQNTGNYNFSQNNNQQQQQQQQKTAQPEQLSGFSQQQQQKQAGQQNLSAKGRVTAQPEKKNDDFDFLDDFGDFKGNQNSNQNKDQVKNQLPQYQNQNQNLNKNNNNSIKDDFFDDFGDWSSKPQQNNNQVKQPTIQNQQKNDDIWGDDFGDFASNNQVKTTTTTNNINNNTNNKMGVGLGLAAVGTGIQAQNKNNLNNKQGTSKYDAFDEFDFDSVNNKNQNQNQNQIQNVSKLDDAKVQQMQSKDKKEEIKMNDEALQKKRSQIEQQHQQQLEQQQKKQQNQQKQNQNQNLQKENNLGKVPGVLSSGGKSVIQPKYQKVIDCRGLENTQLGRTQNIKISITDIKQVDGSFFSSSYYLYTIYTSPLKWTVKRKFSDFQWLHQMLQKQFPASVIPAVHKKYALTSAKSVQSKRTNFLEHFLNNCLKSEEIKNSLYFQQFLELDNEKLFQQDKKKAETSVKIKYLQDFQTLDKKIESKIVQCNEVYNEEMTHMLQGIDVSYEKLINLNKQLMKDYEKKQCCD
ncbi:Phox homologous domain [Pseudocohnilembus persalinus]|uniref:Phox homologous domain n=1 Tax=Pseudocohnilembus persalinus TaxID=266149 RepID=A0A0V0QF99_PSEPJ|nr:Phox homologous domain [Pseudocohnilembus persalinus]|eukprot:KRX00881.1 Phox homologous domain [Pseudocohnilembus persalinus]